MNTIKFNGLTPYQEKIARHTALKLLKKLDRKKSVSLTVNNYSDFYSAKMILQNNLNIIEVKSSSYSLVACLDDLVDRAHEEYTNSIRSAFSQKLYSKLTPNKDWSPRAH